MTDSTLHREQIKAAIRMRGTTLARLSTSLGYQRSAVTVALTRPWPEVRAKVAAFLKTQPELLWPDDYHADGTPKRRRNHTGLRLRCPVQKTSQRVA